MVFVTNIHMVPGGSLHEHIGELAWRNHADGTTGRSAAAAVVDFIDKQKGVVQVTDGVNTVNVHVVKANPPYLRTVADGKWTDNLLALPRY